VKVEHWLQKIGTSSIEWMLTILNKPIIKRAESGRILVSVLESSYTELKFGVPLPVCICMQDKGLQLECAQWTARQSSGGFSVTFFWPAPNQEIKPTAKSSAKKKRRKRRSRPARPKGLCADLGNEHASSSTSGKHDSAAVRTPIDAHHRTNSEKVAYSHAPECPDSNADDSQLEDSSLAPSVRLILWNMLKTFNVISTVSPVSKSVQIVTLI